jgi:hypothetical protein
VCLKTFMSVLTCSARYMFVEEWVYIDPFAHRVFSSLHITLLLNFEKKIARGDMGVH